MKQIKGLSTTTAVKQLAADVGVVKKLGLGIGGKAISVGALAAHIGGRAVGGIALAAGLASYAITSKILKTIKDRKERKAQEAFLAAQAYRTARLKAEELAGRQLTGEEHRALASEFKARLAEIGYTP